MQQGYHLMLGAIFALFSIIASADDHHHVQYGAHDHNSATIEIIKDEQDLEIDIIIPADIHTSFDLQAKSLQEHAEDATWMKMTPKNACSLQKIEAEIDDDHKEHQDLYIETKYDCPKDDSLKKIQFNIFDYYPELENVNVLFIDDMHVIDDIHDQKYHLTKDDPNIRF